MRKFRGSDDLCGLGLPEPCQQFGILDLDQNLACGDVLTAGDRAFCNPAINASRDIDAGRVSFPLNDKGLGLNQIPHGQASNRGHNGGYDNRWGPTGRLNGRFFVRLSRRLSHWRAFSGYGQALFRTGKIFAVI
jgi:hypothetical protein